MMTYEMWQDIPNFSPKEFGTTGMSSVLIHTLQDMRNYTGRRINIHSGYRKGKTGYHPLCMAADLHIENLHIVDQLLIALRFDNFNGIGAYLWWNNPGLHLDVRPKNNKLDYDARWLSVERGKYLPMTAENLKLFY